MTRRRLWRKPVGSRLAPGVRGSVVHGIQKKYGGLARSRYREPADAIPAREPVEAKPARGRMLAGGILTKRLMEVRQSAGQPLRPIEIMGRLKLPASRNTVGGKLSRLKRAGLVEHIDRRWGISSSVDPDGDAKKKSTSERILDVLREADHPLRMSEVYRTMRDPVRIESDQRRASVVEPGHLPARAVGLMATRSFVATAWARLQCCYPR